MSGREFDELRADVGRLANDVERRLTALEDNAHTPCQHCASSATEPLTIDTRWTWCPQCGPHVTVDGDGCCDRCGCTAMGRGANRAVEALAATQPAPPAPEEEMRDAIAKAQGDVLVDYEADLQRAEDNPTCEAEGMAIALRDALVKCRVQLALVQGAMAEADLRIREEARRVGIAYTGPADTAHWMAESILGLRFRRTAALDDAATIRAQLASVEKQAAEAERERDNARREIHENETAAQERYAQVELERDALRKALSEISLGKGSFSRDPLTHATNCVVEMRALALAALAGAPTPTKREGEDGNA